jgi:hypothetical protein
MLIRRQGQFFYSYLLPNREYLRYKTGLKVVAEAGIRLDKSTAEKFDISNSNGGRNHFIIGLVYTNLQQLPILFHVGYGPYHHP